MLIKPNQHALSPRDKAYEATMIGIGIALGMIAASIILVVIYNLVQSWGL